MKAAAERIRLVAEVEMISLEVLGEVVKAVEKHGDQMHVPLGFSSTFHGSAEEAKESTDRAFRRGQGTWMHIAYEEVMETFAEEDPVKARAEALQTAAMFVQIVRRCDREIENLQLDG